MFLLTVRSLLMGKAVCTYLLRLSLALVAACPLPATISIRAVAGDNAINNIKRGTGFEPLVEVVDDAGKVIPDATVTFTLPMVGPGGSFGDGRKTLSLQTDAQGRALARGFRPNSLTGRFEIRISAAKSGETASFVVHQTNAAPAVESKHGRRILILGLVAGAVAGGVLAAQSGGSSPATSASPPVRSDPVSGTITAGAPGFGPPRQP
jgi:hypothetical protein